MITIRIVTIAGETVQVDVQQVEFVCVCPWCKMPFRTIEVDQIYCSRSHKQRAYEIRAYTRVTPTSQAKHSHSA